MVTDTNTPYGDNCYEDECGCIVRDTNTPYNDTIKVEYKKPYVDKCGDISYSTNTQEDDTGNATLRWNEPPTIVSPSSASWTLESRTCSKDDLEKLRAELIHILDTKIEVLINKTVSLEDAKRELFAKAEALQCLIYDRTRNDTGPMGPRGPQGPPGEPGITPEEIITLQCDIANLTNSLYDLREGFEKLKKPKQSECDKQSECEMNTTDKGENKINMNNILNGLDFGLCTNNNVRLSPYGLAIQNQSGTWVSYNPKEDNIFDVSVFNFEGSQFLMKLPVALDDVAIGDVVIHQRKPMFVTDLREKDNEGDWDFEVIDVYSGERKTIMPTRNMFGFNFMTKICSLMPVMDTKSNGEDNAPSKEHPFGNMLPFFLMEGLGDNSNIDPLMLMMLMQNMNGGNTQMNPMIMYALMQNNQSNSGQNSDIKNLLLAMTFMQK